MSSLVNADLCPACRTAQTPSSFLDDNHDSAMRSALQSPAKYTRYPGSEHDTPLNPLLAVSNGRTAVGSYLGPDLLAVLTPNFTSFVGSIACPLHTV